MTILGKILAKEIHETPSKILSGDDRGATARPLPRTSAGPQPGPQLPRLHHRSHAAASSTSWAGICVAVRGLHTNLASTYVEACISSGRIHHSANPTASQRGATMPRQLGRASEPGEAAAAGMSFLAVPNKARGARRQRINAFVRRHQRIDSSTAQLSTSGVPLWQPLFL